MRHPLFAGRQRYWLLFTLWLALLGIGAQAQDPADAFVSKNFNGLRFNRATNTFDTTGSITNTSTDTILAAPMSLVVVSVSDPTISLANMTGTTSDGLSYVDIPLANGLFNPGNVASNILLKFNNPNRLAFSYSLSLRATINGPPGPAPPPTIYITNPAMGALFGAQPIVVSGTINDNTATVSVNGVAATVGNGLFSVTLPLSRDGMQTITAIATNKSGATSQSSVTIGLDTMPPLLALDSPSPNSVTTESSIAIAGMVSDVLTPNPTVTINGVPASVMNGHFIAPSIPLNTGQNIITAIAKDSVGNSRTTTLTVTRIPSNIPHLIIASGQAQSGVVGSQLGKPLVIQFVDASGLPVPNQNVLFTVSRGDGFIYPVSGPISAVPLRSLTVKTDDSGFAGIGMTLGTRTGAGNNRVQVTFGPNSPFLEFCANAASGAPDHISVVGDSNLQTGIVNRPLGAPFLAIISDSMGNPVAGASVTFTVTEGSGSLGGNSTFKATTGVDGIAAGLLTLGPNPGTEANVVTAAYQGQTDPPVTFAATGLTPGPAASTTFVGIVQDNQHQPLANARISIVGTTLLSFTNSAGQFSLTNVPPGTQRLSIDGSQIADVQGRIFPNLEYYLNVISGVENSLSTPVYLPSLTKDSASLVMLTGPVTQDTMLAMPGVPGSSLTLLAGTIARNANGPASSSNPITIRLSRVNNNYLPHNPPNGSTFLLAGTLQPAGTLFSIPLRICMPNFGASPGAQVDVYNLDHDLGQYVTVGFATISEDGSTLCTNPGFGITKAGWFGCVQPPPPNTCAQNCSVKIAPKPVIVCVKATMTIGATGDPSGGTYTWQSSDTKVASISGSGSSVTITGGDVTGTTTITVTYVVTGSNGKPCMAMDSVDVVVVKPSIDIEGIASGDKNSVGGLVVKNSDNNNAPRNKITIGQAGPASFSGKVVLTCNSAKVKVFSSASGGSAITFNGSDNKFDNSTLPKDLFVEGSDASADMRDTELKVAIDNATNCSDTAKFTVLWVEQPTVSLSGMMSADNDKRDAYKGWTLANTYSLGLQRYNDNFGARMGWGSEAKAKVSPAKFDYPGNSLKLERDNAFHDWIGDGTSTIDQRAYSPTIPPANDTGPDAARDDNPMPDGYIYDWDAAGLAVPLAPSGTVHRTRNNFKAFASITLNGKNIRCSPIREYFIVFSMKQIDDPVGTNWIPIDPPDVAQDKQAGNGTTLLSWDLK